MKPEMDDQTDFEVEVSNIKIIKPHFRKRSTDKNFNNSINSNHMNTFINNSNINCNNLNNSNNLNTYNSNKSNNNSNFNNSNSDISNKNNIPNNNSEKYFYSF